MPGQKTRTTLNGGPVGQAGWRAVLPNEKYELSAGGELHRRAGRQAALQDWTVGCTLRGAGGLHIKLGYGKGRSGGLPFSAARPALFRSLPALPSVLSSEQPASPPTVHVFHLETRPSNPLGTPTLQLVLSENDIYTYKT